MTKFKLLLAGSLVAIVSMGLLASNINKREKERVALNKTDHSQGIEGKAMSEEWARYYPRQFDSWAKTKEGDELVDMLAMKPYLSVVWAGYTFAKDYNAPRGHAYAIQDLTNSLRSGAPSPLPTACWACKSPDVPRLIEEDGELQFYTGNWDRYGSEVVNTVGCATCHDDKTAQLSVRVPHLNRGLQAAGLKTFEESTHQEKRSLVCAQCHVEYYFHKTDWKDAKGDAKVAQVVTLPYKYGMNAEGMLKYYDEIGFADWTHSISKTPMLKAQHPEFEFWKTGIHGQKGVSCADCHMPYTQEGSVKYTDHKIGNPLESMDKSCMNCHRESEEKLKDIVKQKFERKEFLQDIAFDNIAKAHLETAKAMEAGATDEELKEVRKLIRHSQFTADYAIAGHGNFFHAPEEVLRLLGSGNEMAQEARLKLVSILAKHGVMDYMAPDFDTKEKAQKLAGLNMEALIAEKMKFKETLEKAWKKEALEKGRIHPKAFDLTPAVDTKSSYYDKTKK